MAVHGGTVAVVTVRPRWDSFAQSTQGVGFFRKLRTSNVRKSNLLPTFDGGGGTAVNGGTR